jgi:hypothetical protein
LGVSFLLTRAGEQSFIFKTHAKVKERLLLLQQKQFKLTLNMVFIFAPEASGAMFALFCCVWLHSKVL